MKSPALPLLVPLLTLLLESQARAGLAEATDFGGDWTSGSFVGLASWVDQATTSIDDIDAAEGRMESWMQTTVAGPTTLYFSYRLKDLRGDPSWPGNGFFLTVGANKTLIRPMERYTIDTGWLETSAQIPDGVQTIKWSLSNYRDYTPVQAYVDQVWTSNDARPRITVESNRVGSYATLFTWIVPVESSTPVTLTATGLPAGLTLDPVTRVISGTCAEAGVFEATLTALNSAGQHVARVVFQIAPGSTTIAEGIDAPSRSFAQPATAWEGVTGIGHDGADSARGFVTSWEASLLSTTFDGPGILTFWYRGEGAMGQPYLRSGIYLYVGIPPSSNDAQLLDATTWTKVTVSIPEGPQTVLWRATNASSVPIIGGIIPPVYVDELTYLAQEPEIVVELRHDNSQIVDGAGQTFGEVLVNGSTNLTFTIKNTGVANLTGLSPTIDGPDAADFAITGSPVAPVAGPTGSTTLTVQFAPTTRGSKTAVLHIPSNDPDENPFDIQLSGTGLGITQQPANIEVTQGSTVSFLVAVEGPLPLFQWQKDGVDIPGAVASALVIPSAQPWHIGEYTVRISRGNGSFLSAGASLALTGVPAHLWRGLVACYPFDVSRQDICRPDKPAYFFNTAALAADPQRGGVAQIRGRGWALPPFPGEPPELQGPGGYLQIPRPPLVDGEPFTISFVIKEEGFSHRHGESLFTMGEGADSTDLLAHYWIGGLDGHPEVYAGPNQEVHTHTSDYVSDGVAVTLTSPWTAFTAAADGNLVRLYRNGQLMGSSAYNTHTIGDCFIGRHWWEGGARFSTRLVAKVDDVRIYNRALSEPEIQQLFTLAQSTPPAGSFDSWVLIHGLIGADAGLAADPDRDGLGNWEEFCFGMSPTDGTQWPIKAVFAGATLTLEWLEITGVAYCLKESPNLVAPWTASPSAPTPSADQTGAPSGYQRMRVTIPVPAAGAPAANRFFRIEAAKGP